MRLTRNLYRVCSKKKGKKPMPKLIQKIPVNIRADALNSLGALSHPQSSLFGNRSGSAYCTPHLRPNFIGSLRQSTTKINSFVVPHTLYEGSISLPLN
ncbi:hypothetical protein TNCV_2222151 [Trichonephila clavipes]|nr:hypothetical protein TNCV_2222151 [Trichonephila clavipes]